MAQRKYTDDGANVDERLLDADFESEKKYASFSEDETFVYVPSAFLFVSVLVSMHASILCIFRRKTLVFAVDGLFIVMFNFTMFNSISENTLAGKLTCHTFWFWGWQGCFALHAPAK